VSNLTETYTTYTASVNFGNGIITAPTTVAVITSVSQTQNGTTTTYPASEGIPLMGVGLNTGGTGNPPGPLSTSPVTALPGVLGQGVLFNEPAGYFQFGTNSLPSYASVSGAPVSTLWVSVTGGGFSNSGSTSAFIDSGGAYGAVPDNRMPLTQIFDSYVPSGDTISVYTGNPSTGGTLLYTQTVTGSAPNLPVVLPANEDFNTGVYPFTRIPIYLSYSPSNTGGTMYFDT
jgi:hypothetical protein